MIGALFGVRSLECKSLNMLLDAFEMISKIFRCGETREGISRLDEIGKKTV